MSGLKLLEKAKGYMEDDSATNFGSRETLNITAKFKDYDGKYLTQKDIEMYFGVSDGLRYANTLKIDITDFPDTKKLVETVNKFPYLETLTLGCETGGIYSFLPDNFHYHELFSKPGLKNLEIQFLRLERNFKLESRITTITLTSLKLFMKHYNPFMDEILVNMGNLRDLDISTTNSESRKPVNVIFGKYIENVRLGIGNLNFLNTSETLRSLDIPDHEMSGNIEPFKNLEYFFSGAPNVDNLKKYIPRDIPKLGFAADSLDDQSILDEIDELFPYCVLVLKDFVHGKQKLKINKPVEIRIESIYGDRHLEGTTYENGMTINFRKSESFGLYFDEKQKSQIKLIGDFIKVEESEKHFKFGDEYSCEIDYQYIFKPILKDPRLKHIEIKNCPEKLDIEFSSTLKDLTIHGTKTLINLNKRDFPSLTEFNGKGVILEVEMDLFKLDLQESSLMKSLGNYEYFKGHMCSIYEPPNAQKSIDIFGCDIEEEITIRIKPELEKLRLEFNRKKNINLVGLCSTELEKIEIWGNKIIGKLDLSMLNIYNMDITIASGGEFEVELGNQSIPLSNDRILYLDSGKISGNLEFFMGIKTDFKYVNHKRIFINCPKVVGVLRFFNAKMPVSVEDTDDSDFSDKEIKPKNTPKSRQGESLKFNGKLLIQKNPFVIQL